MRGLRPRWCGGWSRRRRICEVVSPIWAYVVVGVLVLVLGILLRCLRGG